MRFSIVSAIALGAGLSLAQSASNAAGRRCGSERSEHQMVAAEARFAAAEVRTRSRAPVANRAKGPSTVQVYWHVISSGSKGNLSDTEIRKALSECNKHFNGSIKFDLAGVTRTNNKKFFNLLDIESPKSAQVKMKSSLHKGTQKNLNIYSVGTINRGDIQGYSTFPDEFQKNPKNDGVVIGFYIIAGSRNPDFNQGKIVTHEIGHWLGLEHTFAGGCSKRGDGVADTNPQKEPSFDCKARSTCPGGRPDPIHNYMSYSPEKCMTNFTPGQVRRFKSQIAKFRKIS